VKTGLHARNVAFESGQLSTILAMVAAGTGVSVVPEMAVEESEDADLFHWRMKALTVALEFCNSGNTSAVVYTTHFSNICKGQTSGAVRLLSPRPCHVKGIH